MSNVPGLFVLGEANFADQGANRLGASRAHAGPRRRLLRAAVHDRRLPRAAARQPPVADRRPRVQGGRASGRRPGAPAAVDQRHPHRRPLSTASSARSCGTTAAWPAPSRASTKALVGDPRASARSSGRTCACSARTRRSTSRSRRPGGVADFLEFGELHGAATRCTARRAAAATSARSTRPRTARRCATTSTSRYVAAWEFTGRGQRPGAAQGAARVRVRPPRDPVQLQVSEPQRADDVVPTLHAHHADGLAPGGARRAGRVRDLRRPGVSPDMSFLEMLDIVNERLIARRQGADRVRPRLPRGHLRLVRDDDQRHAARPERGTATCQLHMRKFTRRRRRSTIEPWRAAAFPLVQRPHRRPQRVRPHHRGRRLHHRADRRARPTRNLIPCRRRSPTRRWTRPRASAAARAWPPARTAPASCSPSAKLAHLNLLPQGQAERCDRTVEHGRDDGGVLRLLHEPRRVRGRVPEGDLHRLHRADEPRLRKAQLTQRRLVGQRFP